MQAHAQQGGRPVPAMPEAVAESIEMILGNEALRYLASRRGPRRE